MQALDSNTYYLNEYLFQQDTLQREWDMTKADKRDSCVELARKILLQEVDNYTFNIAFGRYINDSDEKYEWILSVLEDIENRECDLELQRAITIEALESAAYCLFDVELEELLDARSLEQIQIDSMVVEVGL